MKCIQMKYEIASQKSDGYKNERARVGACLCEQQQKQTHRGFYLSSKSYAVSQSCILYFTFVFITTITQYNYSQAF